jgi:cyclophilin family peptidyl-prolyl cis-trans isomerase
MSARSILRLVPVVPAFLLVPAGLSAQATESPKRPLVEVNTTMGRMVLALYNETPEHRDNFLRLVNEHYYDSTLFHRVLPGAMLLGGDPGSRDADDRHKVLGRGEAGATLAPEIRPGIVHLKGAVGMARDETYPASDKRSHGAYFYIIQGQDWTPSELRLVEQKRAAQNPDAATPYTPEQVRAYATNGGAPRMDGEYTVFAQVLEGLDVIDRIAALPCDNSDRPLTDVRIWMRVLP